MPDSERPRRSGPGAADSSTDASSMQTTKSGIASSDAVDCYVPSRALRKPPRRSDSYKAKPFPSVSSSDLGKIRKVLVAPYLKPEKIRLALFNGWTWYQICIVELKGAASPERIIDSWSEIEDAAKQLMRAAGGFSESARAAESVAKSAANQKEKLAAEAKSNKLIVKEQKPQIRQACTRIAWNLYDAQLEELDRLGKGHGFRCRRFVGPKTQLV